MEDNTDENEIDTTKENKSVVEEDSTREKNKNRREGDLLSEELNVSATVSDIMHVSESQEAMHEEIISAEIGNGDRTSTLIFNERALKRLETTYKLETFQKNILIIFNQNQLRDYQPRHGTHKDVEALTKTFKNFNFEINVFNDFTKNEILDKITEFTEQNVTEYGCIGVVMLSHGSKNGLLLAAQNTKFRDFQIIEKLQACKHTLATKPKFLIIQACRGTDIKPPVPVLETDSGETEAASPRGVTYYHLPEEADILVLHSSYGGTPSIRDEAAGSWLIQSLCKTIDRLAATHDFESIITEVKRVVSIEMFCKHYEEICHAGILMCQMPVVTSTLTRKLYLKKFGDPPPLSDPNLISWMNFQEECAAPWNISLHDSGIPSPQIPYYYFAMVIIYILLSLLLSGSLYIHINVPQS